MNKPNPIEGGPLYVEVLARALDRRATASTRPPATGGIQVSLRFSPERLALFDKISGRTGWNRNQVVDALVDGGLNQLFQNLSEGTAKALMQELVRGQVLRQAAEYTREYSHLIVIDGPGVLPPEESTKRRRRVRELADELEALGGRKTPILYQEFEAICAALHQAGFSLPGELVSQVAETFV